MLPSRREFLAELALLGLSAGTLLAQDKGERPTQAAEVKVLNPRTRVPLSFIIDDSTCLVNLAHFCIPQFAEVFPDRYKQDWRNLPREIPDAFVRKFGEWCHEHGVKGKYSIVPYPACVGWVDKEMPGWTRKELEDSLKLVREVIVPDWDIHPEMITHTWIINTKTGRPYDERTDRYMENWRWTDGRSVDELADYMSYALRILKNAGLPCEGITTPGGFAGRVLNELSQATFQSVRDVYGSTAEIPHYFRHLFTDHRSVAPRVEYARNLDGPNPECCVSIIGCTGDWFGGWDGLEKGTVDQFITEDLKGGRLPQVIDKGEPAILVCHWPGIYFNGEEYGFNVFKEILQRLNARYDHLVWMKNSEIARYWAARELTKITLDNGSIHLKAPYACPDFTLDIPLPPNAAPQITTGGKPLPLREVKRPLDLQDNEWVRQKERAIVCFDLPKGETVIGG